DVAASERVLRTEATVVRRVTAVDDTGGGEAVDVVGGGTAPDRVDVFEATDDRRCLVQVSLILGQTDEDLGGFGPGQRPIGANGAILRRIAAVDPSPVGEPLQRALAGPSVVVGETRRRR